MMLPIYARAVRYSRRNYWQRYIANVATSSQIDVELASLIDNLIDSGVENSMTINSKTSKKSASIRRIQAANTTDLLKQICKKFERPLNIETSIALLGRFSSLSFEANNVEETAKWLQSNLLPELSSSLIRDNVSIEDVLVSLTSLISLNLANGPLYDGLLKSLTSRLSSSLSTVPISLLIRLAAAIRTHNVQLSEEAEKLLTDSIQLKTSEVDSTGDAISLLINVKLSPTWLETVLEKVKELLPLMSTGELVSLLANLAARGRRHLDILPLIAAAFHANPNVLTVNQLCTLAQSISTLEFVDARLLRRIASDTIVNGNSIKKWSSISTLAVSFAKLRFGHTRAWRALTNWINANYRKATVTELSFVVSSCAMCDMGRWIGDASRHLASSLNIRKAPSASMWLNSVHALAICNSITPQLAETVLRDEFIEQFSKEEDLPKRIFALSKIAQIQAVVHTEFQNSYKGPLMNLSQILPPSQEVNNAALLIKCGRKEAYDAEFFHSVLYKIAPLGTHATSPQLNNDGFFVDALVQLDSARRFVPVKNFADSARPTIAIVYLGRKQMTITCDEDEESHPIGSVALGLRMLKARESNIITSNMCWDFKSSNVINGCGIGSPR
uniref:RAP domain-containing protein n=1 Tax=Parascaris univalens TaxID=6257 RepID=A0A915A905_PARUN